MMVSIGNEEHCIQEENVYRIFTHYYHSQPKAMSALLVLKTLI